VNPRGNPSTLRPFKKGQSGNPGGVPKGIKHFSALRMVAEALDKES